ncbi:glycoside hydrolase family 78 protein [Larkinella terrae]|uniref:alpha-L-rhamnosidase n=1 Tax=Larkinella terrae TaxID=2025311 RepID=A0A7K0EDJ0_9BACT|nr:glycoside hydrolase family 78 protein [Larkinella terrae]MRS59923.1 Bacterial alpha-L-rhamnosidase [Larkinella terrae]
MKKTSFFSAFFLLSLTAWAQLSVTNLRTENQTSPVGLDVEKPRFSWALTSDKREVKQTAYEIQVKEGKNSVWNSSKILAETSVHVLYAGKSLQSGKRYSWQVRVWDNQGNQSAWSAPANWQMGLLNPAQEFSAQWISSGLKADTAYGIVPQFRKQFSTTKKIESATAFITAKGVYEAYINGKRVGDAYLTPGWTAYNKRLLYQTFDVTKHLQSGKNAVGVRVGNGWYRGELGWEKKTQTYGTETALLFQLVIHYADGSSEKIGSDGSWKVALGPILMSEIYDGEIYDARLEKTGWASADFNEAGWSAAVVKDFTKTTVFAANHEPIRKHETFKPIRVLTTPKGEQVLDFGQNLVGWVNMTVSGKAGDKIVLSHVEVLDKFGNLYFDNLRNAKAQDTYIIMGQGRESFEPHFTFHGFRFVRVEGISGPLNPADFTAIALYSDMKPTGTFTSSNPLVNQLQKNIQWGQKGNFLDVPTDCPQRDERLGWTGDAEVFSRTAAYNFNVNNFFAKWLKDVAAEQYDNGAIPFVIPDILKGTFFGRPVGAAGWSDAGIIIPWNMYVVYGDKRIVETQYPSMKAYLGYMRNEAKNDLWNTGFQFADWLSYRVDDSKGMVGQKSAITDNYMVAQCFYAYSIGLMIKSAKLLGKTDDVNDYENLLQRVKTAFQQEYMTASGRLISETQTAYILALQFDMLPENRRQQAVDRLEANIKSYNYHLTTGFLGTPFLTPVLTRFGKTDVAYKLLLQDTYPSWLFPVKMGATTIWERWDSQKPDSTFQDPGMTSFNHYAYGAVGDWLYRDVAGLDTDEQEAGYKKTIIKPHPGGGLSSAEATFESMYGKVASGWKREGDQLLLTIEIPANTTAAVYVPATSADVVTESGAALASVKGVQVSGTEGAYVVLKVGSGKYRFSAPVGK